MQMTRTIWVAALLGSVMALINLGTAQAEDDSLVWRTMKPLYAVNFDLGRTHVLSYFLSKNDICGLTVMVTDRPNEPPEGNVILPLHTQRFTATIDGGAVARFDTTEGTSLEYLCASNARAMHIRLVKRIAGDSPRAK